MREIKFRGKRVDNGEWVKGHLVCMGSFAFIVVGGGATHRVLVIGEYHAVIPETVGQYIDKKDKNGVELYEGDLIKSGSNQGPIVYGNPHDMSISCDEYSVDYLGFFLDIDETDLEDRAYFELWEKIGTIHDKEQP